MPPLNARERQVGVSDQSCPDCITHRENVVPAFLIGLALGAVICALSMF